MGDVPDGKGRTVDLITAAEWAAVKGTDKNIHATNSIAGSTITSVLSYVVPAGMTLYVFQWSAHLDGAGGIIGRLRDYYSAVSVNLMVDGGSYGFSAILTKPQAIVTGHTIFIDLVHYAAGVTLVRCALGGYEL